MSRKINASIIATTQDTGDPVVRVTLGNSKADIIVDREAECLNVWDVESAQKGDMKKMMDYITEKLEYDWVQFIAPLGDEEKQVADKIIEKVGASEDKKYEHDENNRNLEEVLEGFQEVTEEHNGKEVPMLVGFWDSDK